MSGRGRLNRFTGAARGVLNRLRIRGKLNLLLALPLAAILLVAVPFVTIQINDAQSAARTAEVSGQTRTLGGLISALQRERLVMSAYMANVASRDRVLDQQKLVDDLTTQTRASLGEDAPVEVTQALNRLESLTNLRQSVLDRAATLESLARTYQAIDEALIDALRLVSQQSTDAEGSQQLTALEALLRANEQGTLAGAALVIVASDQQTGLPILDDGVTEAQLNTERFVQQADNSLTGSVVAVDQGDEGRAVQTLIQRASDERDAAAAASFAASAYNAVGAQSKVRADAQDEVTSRITDAAQSRANGATALAWSVGGGIVLLIGLVAALAVVVSRAIANPMKQLTVAATNVAALADSELTRVADTERPHEQVPRLPAIEVATRDEVGELAQAFNRVQATATLLVERQVLTRHNVGLMFANVAQRTQNLVGRQLTLVDELERNEQDTRLLDSLYKLDHLSSRLRRSAENLLVVAGTRNESKLSGPMDLATSLRSALAEIEDYQRVQLNEVCDITLDSNIGPDMVLVFAELLENATSYSPPETAVEVSTRYLTDGSCVITIVDHGIGMTPDRLAEENRRLVARERLDITPTNMLGLFVVGRLARRHNLTVAMVQTEGSGVTVDVVVPMDRFRRNDEPETGPIPVIQAAAAQTDNGQFADDGTMWLAGIAIPPAFSKGFKWFPPEAPEEVPAEPAFSTNMSMQSMDPAVATTAPNAPTAGETTVAERGGLRRRVVGAQLPGATPQMGPAPAPAGGRHAQRDAAQERGLFEGYQSGFERASEEAPARAPAGETSPDGTRSGLVRRTPGAHMAPGLRVAKPGRPPARVSTKWRERDAAADRSKLDEFTTGLSRANSVPMPPETDG
jgi:signal transduction histidine kinase